ncbi:MAG: hypothetical protein Q9192_005932 [Flavoplaca navasiana]
MPEVKGRPPSTVGLTDAAARKKVAVRRFTRPSSIRLSAPFPHRPETAPIQRSNVPHGMTTTQQEA